MRRAIQRFKYNGEYKRGYDLGERLAERVLERQLVPSSGIDLVVPVPLHSRRLRSRGFNQSEILARSVADTLNVPIRTDLVRRQRNTVPQVRLRADQRLENLDRAFAADEECRGEVAGSSVLMVDDVMTTGATLSSLALTLQQAGFEQIFGLTLAREQ